MNPGLKIFWQYARFGIYSLIGFVAVLGAVQFVSKISARKVFVTTDGLGRDQSIYKIIEWPQLRELNVRSGEATENLRALDGKPVQIAGFLVPLEDSESQITDFLLVPSPQACIHVPPPPANQMISVKMVQPILFRWDYRAYWVQGIFSLKSVTSPYGPVSFEMQGKSVEPYRSK